MVPRIEYNTAVMIWLSCDGTAAIHDTLYMWLKPHFGLIVGNCVNISEYLKVTWFMYGHVGHFYSVPIWSSFTVSYRIFP